mmetsp:Transcript_46855/g.108327  ORF Transcript_46855/g.108327 Transcript_46855/m.108327 type:complete len:382 (+) Transcript_46855:38-1183(+)
MDLKGRDLEALMNDREALIVSPHQQEPLVRSVGRRWARATAATTAALGLTVVGAASIARGGGPLMKVSSRSAVGLDLVPVGYMELLGECGGDIPGNEFNVSLAECAAKCDALPMLQPGCAGFSWGAMPQRCSLHSRACNYPSSSTSRFYRKIVPTTKMDGKEAFSGCHDRPYWTNILAADCFAYARNGWCTSFGSTAEKLGKGMGYPEKHCCVCGGGVTMITPSVLTLAIPYVLLGLSKDFNNLATYERGLEVVERSIPTDWQALIKRRDVKAINATMLPNQSAVAWGAAEWGNHAFYSKSENFTAHVSGKDRSQLMLARAKAIVVYNMTLEASAVAITDCPRGNASVEQARRLSAYPQEGVDKNITSALAALVEWLHAPC